MAFAGAPHSLSVFTAGLDTERTWLGSWAYPDAFTGAGDAPSGSMEVYLYGKQNVVLVQVRAPTQNRDVLARNLLEWLNGVKAAKLLLACSSDSSSRHDNQMQ